ncbi:MAG: PPOX class F420-dependent oxidoreductase [Actinomycetota bacterium]|nr:PPOX class F420-dependent oxidoreductase [Candidatus Dormibacteraeota bacterium]MDQ6945579.1 PPOX class F420-dependent oxidoreductase [Actinomycetota bacterium]
MSEQKPAAIPREFEDLFRGDAVAQLATTRSDGTPHLTPIWIDLDGDRVLVNARADRLKARHMQRRADVAICIVDPTNPYRYIALTGQVETVDEAGALAHMDRLSARYLRVRHYPWAEPGERRLLFRIRPIRVSCDPGNPDIPEPDL